MSRVGSCLMTLPHPKNFPALRVAFIALGLAVSCTAFAAAASARKPFNISAGDALTTLKQFAQQSGIELLYSVDDLKGVRTSAVQRELPPREALEVMLEGTGLAVTAGQKTGAVARKHRADAQPAY